MNLISKHLNKENLKSKIFHFESETICAFTGEKISEGIKLSEIAGDTFTDHTYIKYDSEYVSLDIALLIQPVIRIGDSVKKNGKENWTALRNYSYYASENELTLLKRENILDLLLNIPDAPFCFAVTYSNKKHTSFKCRKNTNKDVFTVTTDVGEVLFNKAKVLEFLQTIQNWYSIIPEKKDTAAQPTFFTKANILGEFPMSLKISEYGEKKFEEENNFLLKYRNTSLFELVVHLINKHNG
jgi:hypothetical protein